MPRKFFKRILPDPAKIKENRFLGFLGNRIHDSDIWHLNKHSVAGAFFIGIFCAFQPIPLQVVLAAFLAFVFKKNLALSVALVFITNPLTMPPIFYLSYRVGSLFLGESVIYEELAIDNLWNWLVSNFERIGKPLFLGSFICGVTFGYLSYVTILIFWRWQVKENWRQRKLRRQEKKAQKRASRDA